MYKRYNKSAVTPRTSTGHKDVYLCVNVSDNGLVLIYLWRIYIRSCWLKRSNSDFGNVTMKADLLSHLLHCRQLFYPHSWNTIRLLRTGYRLFSSLIRRVMNIYLVIVSKHDWLACCFDSRKRTGKIDLCSTSAALTYVNARSVKAFCLVSAFDTLRRYAVNVRQLTSECVNARRRTRDESILIRKSKPGKLIQSTCSGTNRCLFIFTVVICTYLAIALRFRSDVHFIRI